MFMRCEKLKKAKKKSLPKSLKVHLHTIPAKQTRGNREAEGEFGERTKESQASYWLILVNYPGNEKQKLELAN